MAKTSEVVKRLQKQYGQHSAKSGTTEYEDIVRVPTGIFTFDLAVGGGFPMGRCSEVFGPESSGKTNKLIRAIAMAQRLWPDKKPVFIDAEHSLDLKWAATLGVDVENLILCEPEYAEQAIDMVLAFMYAEDVSVIGLDSIAALCTQNESESSAEKANVGGASAKVGGMYRKILVAGQTLRGQGIMPPAFIAINQIRHKIGVMFGDPETTPGGNAPRFAATLRVRTYGKALMDKKIHPAMPFAKTTSFIVRKWKVPILATTGEYTMNMLPVPGNNKHSGPVGHVNDWNTLSHYMMQTGYLEEESKGKWVMMSEDYPSAIACRDALYEDRDKLYAVQAAIIAELVDKGVMLGAEEGENDKEEGEISET